MPSSVPTTRAPPNNAYLQWKPQNDGTWALQTAVTTFVKDQSTVELHAQVHLAEKEYFEYYNTQFSKDHTVVLYELLVEESLLDENGQLQEPIGASDSDRQAAQGYGWTCQADVLDYRQPHWYHADFTRQEFLQAAGASDGSARPLWQLVASGNSVTEAATALLVGPPLKQTTSPRLFTNLFLPGQTLTSWLRSVLWWTVPAPELSVALLDWSAWSGKGLSPIAASWVQALVQLQWTTARRLSWGQVLASSTHVAPDELLILARNERAMKVWKEQHESSHPIALLYGCSHCPDLHVRLLEEGYSVHSQTWRTAWSTNPIPAQSSPTTAALVLILYLALGAGDWIWTWQDVVANNNGVTDVVAYLVRHVFLYLTLSKFLLDWDKR